MDTYITYFAYFGVITFFNFVSMLLYTLLKPTKTGNVIMDYTYCPVWLSIVICIYMLHLCNIVFVISFLIIFVFYSLSYWVFLDEDFNEYSTSVKFIGASILQIIITIAILTIHYIVIHI